MAESRISMEEEKLFRIGDVAKMFHISTGTLRHYERIGIVVPEFIEEKSSYRYYGIRQFEVLNTIRYLRVLDMPLEQIADFLANRDIQVIEEKLQNQKEMIREKKRQLDDNFETLFPHTGQPRVIVFHIKLIMLTERLLIT